MRAVLLWAIGLVINLSAYELGIVSMFRNEAPYLKEWVEYHHMVGVEHFWLYDNGSTDDFRTVLEPYIQAGIVEIIDWPSPFEYGAESHMELQKAAFRDGLKRSEKCATWIALIDSDEFIVPMQDASLTECLREHFAEADAIYANWRHFGTSGVYVPLGKPFVFHLTQASLKSHKRNRIGKTIVRPSQADIDGLHYLHHVPLKQGGVYVTGNAKPLLVDFYKKRTLKTEKSFDKYIRINHYALRDEHYFWNVRLKRTNYGYGGGKNLLREHYKEYASTTDTALMDLIRQKYPEKCQSFWHEK